MLRFILTRLSLLVPTFIGMTLLAFFLIRLVPGDPIETMAGERGIDPERHAQLRAAYGFDKPVLVQYGIYIGRVLHGDLGKSIITQDTVMSEFLSLFPATMELAVCAILFALLLGLPAGILAAVRRNSIFDHGVMATSLTGYSMPIFWWGLLLILFFSVQLGWTPVSGRIAVQYFIEPETGFLLIDSLRAGDIDAFWSALHHLILPAIVLGTVPLAVIARMTRSAMLEVLGEDYIRTARAKGLSRFRVVGLHALRNALIPVVPVIGLQVGVLFTGAILTETIFSWPGVGKWLIEAIGRRDYPVLQGGMLLLGGLVFGIITLANKKQGGKGLGIGAIVWLTPEIDRVAGLLALVFAGALAGGWIAGGGPRIAYAGFQLSFAFFLCVIQGSGPAFDLTVARDRVIGILIGNAAIYLIFVSVWPVSIARRIDPAIAKLFRGLARIARMPDRAARRDALPATHAAVAQVATDLDIAGYEPVSMRPGTDWFDRRDALLERLAAVETNLLLTDDRVLLDAEAARLDALAEAVGRGDVPERPTLGSNRLEQALAR